MTVRSIHASVSEAALRSSTGFELGDLSDVPPTPEPTEQDLYLLRNVVDPRGHLLPDLDQGE